jgi:hypothetical protein
MSIVILFSDRVTFTVPMKITSKINLKQNQRSFQRMGGAVGVLVLINTTIVG